MMPIDITERRQLWLLIAALLLVISLPYAWAAATAPDGFEYFGLLYNPDDQNVHLAWARQAAQGRFFFRDLFTTESLANAEQPLFTNLFCWLMGVLSALTQVPLIWIYHALRLLFAALALHWFYALCTVLTPARRIRRRSTPKSRTRMDSCATVSSSRSSHSRRAPRPQSYRRWGGSGSTPSSYRATRVSQVTAIGRPPDTTAKVGGLF